MPLSRNVRVVVVDDTDEVRQMIGKVLSRRAPAWTVVAEAVDGSDGVDVVRREQPELVLLDVSMPVLDGLAALPQIRAAAPAASVIVMSASDERGLGRRATAAGANAFVSKYVLATELVPTAAAVLAATG